MEVFESRLKKKWNLAVGVACLMAGSLSGVPLFASAPEMTTHSREGEQVRLMVKGVVVDADDLPLIGVTVREKGVAGGTITDVDGKFSLNVPKGAILQFSYVGMKTTEVVATQERELRVVLQANSEQLDEVMVTGYQTLSKERSTGAFTQVKAEKFETRRMENLGSILEGQVAGYVDGKIRGITTMSAVANPLVVIDGFPVENTGIDRMGQTTDRFPELNPEDIESVTVLKDAAAASIYGARAANGVIVITTKKAALGKTEISLSTSYAFQPYSYYVANRTDAADVVGLQRAWAAQSEQLQSGVAGASVVADDLRTTGAYPSKGIDILLNMYTQKIGMEEGEKLLNELAAKGYRYYDQAVERAKRNPIYRQYNIRLANRTDRNSFALSTTYWDNQYEDIFRNDKKLGVNLSNSLKLTDWLQADVNVYLKYGKEQGQSFDVLSPGFSFLPYDELFDEFGASVAAPSQIDASRRELIARYGLREEVLTPLDELRRQLSKTQSLETRASGRLNFDLAPWAKYHVMFQYETGEGKTSMLREREAYDVVSTLNNFTSLVNDKVFYNLPEGDVLATTDTRNRSYNLRHQLSLTKDLGTAHSLAWILGQEVRESKLEYQDNTRYGYDSDLLNWPAYNAASLAYFSGLLGAAQFSYSSNTSQRELLNRFVSFYSNASYSLLDKYTLSGSIRWDRSNLWGTSSKYQNKPVWSMGGSWNVDKESFFRWKAMDRLQLRMSYGIGGNIGRNTAPYLVASYYPAILSSGLFGVVTAPPNKDIRWEKTTTFNLGVDFSFLRGRLYGSIDYYNKYSADLLAYINSSPTQGFGYSMLTTNNGEMLNRGVELTLHATLLKSKDFRWDATGLYAFNHNRVKKIHIDAVQYNSRLNYPTSFPTEGNPLHGIYAYRWAGLSPTGEPQVYDAEGNVTSQPVRDSKAIVYCGTSMPPHSGTLTNVLRYKDVEFSLQLLLLAGHKLRDTFVPAINMGSGRVVSTHKDILKRWQQAGDENRTQVPRLLFSDNRQEYNTHRSELYGASDLFVYNASHLRVNNLSLAYYLPKTLTKKLFLRDAKLQFIVENLAVIAFDGRASYALGGKQNPNFVGSIHLNF